jgi:uncharacterized glyoxalase superfamily protein PhnB
MANDAARMQQSVVPMMHVPDVRLTVEWYESVIGFTRARVHEERGQMLWALMRYGNAEVMINVGGKASDAWRREVDLYILAAGGVDGLYRRWKDRVDVVEEPHDTEYGMRELIVRDLNRFWITVAQPLAST